MRLRVTASESEFDRVQEFRRVGQPDKDGIGAAQEPQAVGPDEPVEAFH